MLPVNEYHFYELAIAIHPLTFAPNDTKYSDVWYDWWNAKNLLNTTFVERRPLSICRPAANKLYLAITQFVPDDFDTAVAKVASDPDQIDPVLGVSGYSLREAAKEFETVLQAELQSMDTYFVSQKGGYKTHDLIERAHVAFPASVRASVRDQTKVDFDQAGKCIAFDIPTAAGFHLLRGTESVIRDYYKVVTEREPKLQMRNWGAYNENLKKKGADQRGPTYSTTSRSCTETPFYTRKTTSPPKTHLCSSVFALVRLP
ncbi:MAG: hypothetical protein WB799_12865 [Candidatus Sulfotelmatobacter sp.]